MRLLAPYTYIDPAGLEWGVPEHAETDGASIPRICWSLVGGPYEGRYRGPAVIHDWFCDRRVRRWEATHRMFFDAMLAAGVGLTKAKAMYFAVRTWGPRWNQQAINNSRLAYQAPRDDVVVVSTHDDRVFDYLSHLPIRIDLASVPTAPEAPDGLIELALRVGRKASLPELEDIADEAREETASEEG